MSRAVARGRLFLGVKLFLWAHLSFVTHGVDAQTATAQVQPDINADSVQALERAPLPDIPNVQLPPPPNPEPVQQLTPEQYREGAFEAAQWTFRTDAAVALDRLAARVGAGGGALGDLEQELQRLTGSLRAVDQALSGTFEGSESGPQSTERRNLHAQSDRLQVRIHATLEEIQTRFPSYSELVRPQAYSFAAVQALLQPDEALLLIVNSDDASYLFAISRDRYDWFRSPDLPRSEVELAVKRLRASLAASPGEVPGQSDENRAASQFDRQLAYRLYRGLIEPARDIIRGKTTLFTISAGALASLPLNVLVTEAPSGSDEDPNALATTKWLSDQYVLASLPAVSSLVALRCLLREPRQRSSGCAALSVGMSETPRAVSGGSWVAAAGAPELQGSAVALRRGAGAASDIYQKGHQLADPEYLRRRYARLPGARAELEQLRILYGARAHLLLGAAATERAVKNDQVFRSAPYIVFATHTVLAVRAASQGEPGLIFTPPVPGREDETDDGFLSASEVATMQFNAQLIILSSCNTASSEDGFSGEGLSGLARSFFFAGARSLLVSHWEVNDRGTSLLMAALFRSLEEGHDRNRGQALQSAMQTLRTDPRFANPRYWAAFTLVGDVQ